MTLQNVLSAFIAALIGLVTAVAIEAVKTLWFDRRLKNEEREHQKIKDLLGFYAPAIGSNTALPPIASILISSPAKRIKVSQIKKGLNATEITSSKEILIPIEDAHNRKKAHSPRKFLFWNLPPKGYFSVNRTYYRRLLDDFESAELWETKKDVISLGQITSIGRRKSNDIYLPTTLVSRQHAVIRYENGSYVLYNLAITNEIFVNDQKIEFNHILQNDDVIEITPYFLEFKQRAYFPKSNQQSTNSGAS